MASSPTRVARILIRTLSLSTFFKRFLASAIVPAATLQPLFLGLGLGLERLCQLLQMRRYSDTP
jgi:hypothetical protein